MAKYRIITVSANDLTKMKWKIQYKSFWGWKTVKGGENRDLTELEFGSYVEAEHRIIKVYCNRQGEITQPRPNEYHYHEYTYYV